MNAARNERAAARRIVGATKARWPVKAKTWGAAILERNRKLYENSLDKWKAYDLPVANGTISRSLYIKMLGILTTDEEATLLRVFEATGATNKAAWEVRCPWAFATRFIRERTEVRGDPQELGEATVLARFEFVQRKVAAELVKRVRTDGNVKKLSLEELSTIAKTCRENIVSILGTTSGVDKDAGMTVVTKMPFDEDGEKEAS